MLVLWALMMLVETGDQNASINSVYDIILKILGCFTLFLFANLLKRLFAKLMALKFTNSNQKQKMERALKKVRYCLLGYAGNVMLLSIYGTDKNMINFNRNNF